MQNYNLRVISIEIFVGYSMEFSRKSRSEKISHVFVQGPVADINGVKHLKTNLLITKSIVSKC